MILFMAKVGINLLPLEHSMLLLMLPNSYCDSFGSAVPVAIQDIKQGSAASQEQWEVLPIMMIVVRGASTTFPFRGRVCMGLCVSLIISAGQISNNRHRQRHTSTYLPRRISLPLLPFVLGRICNRVPCHSKQINGGGDL